MANQLCGRSLMSVEDINKPTLALAVNSGIYRWPLSVPEGTIVLVRPCSDDADALWYKSPFRTAWTRCHRGSKKATVMLTPALC